MKTIVTTLPIYDKIEKQCYERANHNINSGHGIVPILTPRHRLPSFQWKDGTDGAATPIKIELINESLSSADITNYLAVPNLLPTLNTVHVGYSPFTTSGLSITSAIQLNAAATYVMFDTNFNTLAGDKYRFYTYLTKTSGELPSVSFWAPISGLNSNKVQLVAGWNDITLTVIASNDSYLQISNTTLANWSTNLIYFNKSASYFISLLASHVITGDVYFQYKGDTLNYLLPVGEYYLKITMNTGHVYYSEWFKVDCVYENLITSLTNAGYDTLTKSGTIITSAVEAGVNPSAYSDTFAMRKDETVKVFLFFTYTSGQYPSIELYSGTLAAPVSNVVALHAGLNEVTLTAISDVTDAMFVIFNTIAANFATSEIFITRPYSDKYLILNFHNTCDLGDILYHDGFTQTLWFESETMEPSFPLEEEGQKNGEGRFVKTFARQTKKYLARTKNISDYMVDVLHRLRLHDTITLTDLVGDTNTVYNLEVEHEWLFDDKYYAKAELTFDYDETIVLSGCCSNII